MKQRFSSLDVKVIAHELSNALCNFRLANAYDLSSRVFLLKFARPDLKQQMIIESGFRCHLTHFSRTTAAAPSPFVARLRKFLRSRRVTGVFQIGTDRVIEIQFSDGQYRLFLEFYAGGNIVLTDKDYNILALLRIVSEQEELKVGLKYSLENCQNFGGIPPLTTERLKNALEKTIGKKEDPGQGPGKKQRKSADSLRKALAVGITEYPPMLIDHALRVSGFSNSLRPEEVLKDDELIGKLLLALNEAESVMRDITSAEESKGYIIAKPRVKDVATPSDTAITDHNREVGHEEQSNEHGEISQFIYEDFHPFLPRQIDDDPSLKVFTFDGFNKTVDEFFSSIEGHKLESRLHDREENAKNKIEAARKDHEKRIDHLQEVQQLNVRKAQAIETNLQKVEEATASINGLIGQGMDWVEIAKLIEIEKTRNNPVAEMIKLPLKLYENTVTLLLGEEGEDEGDFEGDETDGEIFDSDEDIAPKERQFEKHVDERLFVDIDLGLSPWANARQYYGQKRTAAVKEQKTLQSSSKALKSTEKKITADLKKGLKQEKRVLRPVRAPLWFEKFYFFISSDGYLVLRYCISLLLARNLLKAYSGRDTMQAEILYQRYLKRGDVYVHADIEGAASVIVKNNPTTPNAPIPPSTLSQAGNLAIAASKAWDSKAVLSAWWVNSDQISKTASTGEYLTTGGFLVKGEKNFLQPAQLLLGFAVMFQISEESKLNHAKHRLKDQTGVDDTLIAEATATTVGEHTGLDAEDVGRATESDDDDFPDARLESDSGEEDKDHSGSNHDGPLATSKVKPIDSRLRDMTTQDGSDIIGEGGPSHDELAESKYGSASSSKKGSTRHLSAKERRLLRKPRGELISAQCGNIGNEEKEADIGPTGSQLPSVGASGWSTPSGAGQKPQVRGKRGKQKKFATKYAHQDDEDRALAMKSLGSAAAEAKEEEEKARFSKDLELIAQRQRRREQHERAAAKGKEQEEARWKMYEENAENSDESQQSTIALDSFVGAPLPGDEILEAIPVCAPWAALSRHKYKAKLQPGPVKKGKAVRDIVSLWIREGERRKIDVKSEDVEKMWPRENELIKAWRESELTNTIPVGKVKVMMSGASGSGVPTKGVSKEGKPKGGNPSKKKR